MFHYYTQQEVDMANYTMSNASFIAEIKMLQLHLIFYGKLFFNPRNGKGDGSCLYVAVLKMFGLKDSPLERNQEKTSLI